MKKRFLLVFLTSLFAHYFFTYDSLLGLQSTSANITITIEDSFTNQPVDSVLVQLLQNGSELTSGLTGSDGTVELPFNFTSISEDLVTIPESFKISESYPNPFQTQTSVDLEIAEQQEVTAEVFNVIGQKVASLSVQLKPGVYTLRGALGHLAQGMYFLRIRGQEVKTVKMTKIGNSFTSSGAVLQIAPSSGSPFRVRAQRAGSAANSEDEDLTIRAFKTPYDSEQRTVAVQSDTTFNLVMSRNNTVVFRVADQESPSTDIERSIRIEKQGIEQEIVTPDTLILKSGIYTITADEGITDAINTEVEIASEDKTVTLLSRLRTIAGNQILLNGVITDSDTQSPIDRAYVFVADEATGDTLAGPLFADNTGNISEVIGFDDTEDKQLRLLFRKAGFVNTFETVTISLPDTVEVEKSLDPAPAPVASFTVSGDLQAGQPVQFDGSASTGFSGEDLVYSWDFGNGKRGFGQTISHVYTSSINATVTLTVSGQFAATDTAMESINISNAPNPPSSTIINGEITTVDLEPLENVTANLVNNDQTSISGTDGKIVIPDLPSGVPIVMQLTKPGYAAQTVRITPDEESEENFFTTAMIPLEQSVTVPAIENGTNISGKFGTRVNLPVDALVDANGELVTGDVDLTMTPLDVSSDEIFAFPGGFEGVRPDGEQSNIISFGVADFTFTQNGETLQMMPGKSAEIEIPVTNADVEVGDVIPLWTLDEDTGLWIEEGAGKIIIAAGSPTGLAMIAKTGHFSWKNIDVFIGGTGFESRGTYTLIPRCKNSETDEFIACTIRGRSLNADGSVAGYAPTIVIPANPITELLIPAGRAFEIEALAAGVKAGIIEVAPTPADQIKEVVITLDPSELSEPIPIAYGDLLKGKATNTVIQRYVFEGEQDDFIRIRTREGLGFEGTGDVLLLNSDEEILEQGNYANNFSRYLFENLPETGTYFIDVIPNTDISNFDIELDLFKGPINRQISYGDRVFDFLWPGITNTYTFEGQTEEVFELISRNVSGEGTLFGKIVLNTTNPLVSDSTTFFDFDAWVELLEEKDGIYTLEVSGAEESRFGEYILDFNLMDNFAESGNEIAYGDSIIGKVTEAEPNNTFTFEGFAGDLVRLHIDKPYPQESENRITPLLKLSDPSMIALDEVLTSFRGLGNDAGIGYILPFDGTYTVDVETDYDSNATEGELFSLLLRNIVNPFTRDLDEAANGIYKNEFFANELDINRYIFSGASGQFTRLFVDPAFSQHPDGKLLVFDENSQFIASDNFLSNTSSDFRKRSLINASFSDGEYTGIVVSKARNDVQQSSNQTYNIQMKKAETREFNTTTNEQYPPNTIQYFHFINSEAGREVSVAAVGSYNRSVIAFEDPLANTVSVNFASSQSFLPTILENQGDYLLRISSGSFSSANFDLTVVDLEPTGSFKPVLDDIISLTGTIRLNGDIDRFDFTPDTDGTITITLQPAAENSIDDAGNLRIQIRNPDTNGLVSASSETPNPAGDELYIWQGNVSGQNDYRIHVWDQEAITSGDFFLEVTFTPDP